MGDRVQPWKEWIEKEMLEKSKERSDDGHEPKPWLTWQPTPDDPSVKPWLTWNPNIDNGDVDPNKKIIKTQVLGGCSGTLKKDDMAS